MAVPALAAGSVKLSLRVYRYAFCQFVCRAVMCCVSQAVQLREEFNIDIRVLAVADSKRMLTSESGIDLDNWRQGETHNWFALEAGRLGV